LHDFFSSIVNVLSDFFTVIHDQGVSVVISNPNISYGVAIIIFTLIIRTMLLPLNIKQMTSQLKMSEIQPELKKLQEKYKNDPQKANIEVMKFYKEKGVNPLAGCLPLLIQMPILFAMFWVFKGLFNDINPKPSFLWLNNLGAAEQNLKIAGIDTYIRILPILSGASTYISSTLIAVKGDSAQAKQTATMNIFMGIMLVFMSWKMNAALVIYWIIGNLYQITQTYVMKNYKKKSLEDA